MSVYGAMIYHGLAILASGSARPRGALRRVAARGEGIDAADAVRSFATPAFRLAPLDYWPCPFGAKLSSGRYRTIVTCSVAIVLSSELTTARAAGAP